MGEICTYASFPFFYKKEAVIIPRLARKNLDTPFIHVMIQGVNKEYIFNKNEYIEKYLSLIKENKEEYNFTIMAYCIMNNHAHFLVYTEDMDSFSKFMHKINLLFAQMYNKKENRCGVLFRNRYRTEPIYNKKYIVNCIKYIHNNPVKAKMVSACEEYKYSSYSDYINNTGVTESKIVKEIFGSKCNFKEIFEEVLNIEFMDIDKASKEEKIEYIQDGIRKFEKNHKKKTFEIMTNRNLLKELINYLNSVCGIKYKEIRNFFEIPRGTMDKLKEK